EDVSGAVDEHTIRTIQLGASGRAAVPAEAIRPIPGYSLNNPGGGHDFPDAIIVSIGDENIFESVHTHTARVLKCGVGGWAAISAVPFCSVPSGRRQLAGWINLVYSAS